MGNFFDILLVAVTFFTVVICYKLGIFKLLKPFRKLLAFLFAWTFKDSAVVTGTVGKLIRVDSVKKFINGRVEELWGEKLYQAAEADGVPIAQRFDDVFGFVGKLFSNLKSFCTAVYERELVSFEPTETVPFSQKLEEFVLETVDYITDCAIGFFTTFVGFLILYILASIIFRLVAKALDSIFSDGFLGFLNRCLGGVAGICYGFIFAWLFSLFLVLALPLISSVPQSEVLSGAMGVTEWYATEFFISKLLGVTV